MTEKGWHYCLSLLNIFYYTVLVLQVILWGFVGFSCPAAYTAALGAVEPTGQEDQK